MRFGIVMLIDICEDTPIHPSFFFSFLHKGLVSFSQISSGVQGNLCGCHLTRLQPSLERHDAQRPAERKTREGDDNVQEHHLVVTPSAHRGQRELFRAELEHQATSRKAESGKRLSRGAAGQNTLGWAEPDEEVGQTT